MRGNSPKLHQGGSSRKIILQKSSDAQAQLPREWGHHHPWGCSRMWDVVLGDVVSGHGGLDMRILEVFSNQNLKGI